MAVVDTRHEILLGPRQDAEKADLRWSIRFKVNSLDAFLMLSPGFETTDTGGRYDKHVFSRFPMLHWMCLALGG